MKISEVSAYQIYDSRGNPTVEARVELENGIFATGLVPSGASTGQFEAHELRDGDASRFRGLSVQRAVKNVEEEIRDAVVGKNVTDQAGIDVAMIELDGTANKSRLGANAILSVSMAASKAAANVQSLPLFRSLGSGDLLPLPEVQLVGGGAHANWRIDVQDFMLVAIGAATYEQALEMTFDVYHAAGDLLSERGLRSGLADEGGYWPNFSSNEEAFDVCLRSIERAGYVPGKDLALSLDIAASDLFDGERYHFRSEDKSFSREEFLQVMLDWCESYPIVSVEDPFADTDIESWQELQSRIGDRVQLIGDDLFTTNPDRIRDGIDQKLANAVLIKPNQIGTVTETLEAIRLTQQAGWRPVVSARSGETEDSFIAHLAVATNAGQLKVGSFARSERMAKWNEVLRISHELGDKARFSVCIGA
jgi:enolase